MYREEAIAVSTGIGIGLAIVVLTIVIIYKKLDGQWATASILRP